MIQSTIIRQENMHHLSSSVLDLFGAFVLCPFDIAGLNICPFDIAGVNRFGFVILSMNWSWLNGGRIHS
uniref:Uncharacterized protein n=2 Tax=Arabidopsis thaliana TaxID=3702 RepID=Q1G3X8_ARATH|nr:unknown protein [Arabidopsis thaliana]